MHFQRRIKEGEGLADPRLALAHRSRWREDKAVAQSPGRTGDHAATLKQAMRLIEHLTPTPEEKEMIRAAFEHLPQATGSAEA